MSLARVINVALALTLFFLVFSLPGLILGDIWLFRMFMIATLICGCVVVLCFAYAIVFDSP